MADKPILFSAPMVRALLAGRKTQTRRVLQTRADPGGVIFDGAGGQMDYFPPEEGHGRPTYAVNDHLWVREAWRADAEYDDLTPSEMGGEEPIRYDADGAHQTWGYPAISKIGRYRHARFMPRWASRLTLIVTDVRLQRLNDITRGDAMAEGCPFPNMQAGPDPRDWFRDLWASLHGPDAWGQNPFVAVYGFTVHHSNIDRMETHHG